VRRGVFLRVKDMLDSMERVERFVTGMSYDDFVKDDKTSSAAIRCVEIMGEAAKHVPESLRRKYPEIPWRSIAVMRDMLTHAYFAVALQRIWLVIKEDIPQLRPQLQRVMKDLEAER